jgi:cyclophilin family peptidyl-prolyl cis-trans isomerase
MKKLLALFVLVMFSVLVISCGKEEPKKEQLQDTTKKLEQKMEEKKDTTIKQDTVTKKEDEALKEETKGGDIMKLETSMGVIKIKMFTDKAPMTTKHISGLVEKGFYNGIIFHRVIDGFMIQTGDPTGTGRGGSGTRIKDEFGPGLNHNKAGIVSMANAGPNTGDSQFFICLDPQPHLDGKHAIFGEVISGMDVVRKIGKVKTGPGDRPVDEVKIIKATMVDK